MAPSEVPDYEPFDQPDGECMRQTRVVALSPSLPPQTLGATTVATMNCLLCSLTRDAPDHQVITWGGYATGKVRREEIVRVEMISTPVWLAPPWVSIPQCGTVDVGLHVYIDSLMNVVPSKLCVCVCVCV